MPHQPARPVPRSRRGSVYVAILGVAMLVTLIGMAALAATRMQRVAATANIDMIKARSYAESATELAMLVTASDSTWRTDYTSGSWFANTTIGDGTYSISVVDPLDGNLSNRPTDPVTVTATGSKGQATQMVQVSLQASGPPIDALAMAIHTAGQLMISSGNSLTVSGAPASTNGALNDVGNVVGDAQCTLATNPFNVSGTLTLLAPSKAMPDSGVFAMYTALATTIAPGSMIDKQVLGPGVNPYGAANTDGVYYWNTGGSNVTLRRSRILGTLLIDCPGKTVTIDKPVLLQPSRSDYPCLIVNGSLNISYDSSTQLDEGAFGTNFNPVGAPYSGVTDADQSDTYPSELQGLVHVRETLTFSGAVTIRGCVIVESSAGANAVSVSASPSIIYTPSLYTSPPMGYMKSVTMSIVPGSWKQVVN